jgi:hypothetical protein
MGRGLRSSRLAAGSGLELTRDFDVEGNQAASAIPPRPRAATAVEYSMVAAGVGLAVAAIVMSLGSMLKITFYDKLLGLM